MKKSTQLKLIKTEDNQSVKTKIKPINKRKFTQLKKIQKERMQFEDYSWMKLFGYKEKK